jgi:sugar transferase (PEP-CTERM/EpsH1 system associated)
MGKVRILRIVNSMDIGGLERGVTNLTLNLDKTKFEHVFCCLNKKGHFGERLEEEGIKVYELRKKKGFGLRLVPQIRSIIKKEKIDIIHTHNTDPFQLGILSFLFIRDIVRIHTDHNTFANRESRLALLLNQILSIFTNKIIAVSHNVKEDWIKKVKVNPRKLIAVYNGVDLKKLDFKVNINKERQKLGLSKKDLIIGIVARLSREKDHLTLFRAFSIVNSKAKNAKLLVVGDGALRKYLERFVEENRVKNVIFLGRRNDAHKLIKLFDIFVLSSINEGCSQTIEEAMASSKPVVATSVGGNVVLVKDKETGILVPKKDPKVMADALLKLIRDRKLRKEMGRKGRERAEKYFTIEKQARKYEEIYDYFIRKKGIISSS